MPVPCAVELCPAFTVHASKFCSAHQHAKKLAAVQKGRTCARCERVLREGDYVTVDSTPDRLVHAECPKPQPRVTKKERQATPLYDDVEGERRSQ